ncbi:MAG: DNA/RNA non-specific endonuclease, partial [Syntrophothermus sp.]
MSSPFSTHSEAFVRALKSRQNARPSRKESSVKSFLEHQEIKLPSDKSLIKSLIGSKPEKHAAESHLVTEDVKKMLQPDFIRNGKSAIIRDLERYIGTNDILPINYLTKGIIAANSVCRISTVDPLTGQKWWGTGFLISPRLMITNNHVIPSAEAAANTIIEFGCERDKKGFVAQGEQFELKPELGFITSPSTELDFTIVAVSDISRDGDAPLSNYGFLRLSPNPEKIVEGEFVTVIQHPNGDEKCIAVRENKVIQIGSDSPSLDNFLWYMSDTAPGSSGAPAFNDFWQVVAIHHSGIPESRKAGKVIQYQLVTGKWVTQQEAKEVPDDQIKWIANEGVRISKILQKVKKMFNSQRSEQSPFIKEFLDDAFGQKPFSEASFIESATTPNVTKVRTLAFESFLEAKHKEQKNIRPVSYYKAREGYNEDFLGVNVPLPKLTEKALSFGAPAAVAGANDNLLKYTHFSILFNKDRKMAFFTAVNIDGKKWKNIKRGTDKWYYDSRIPKEIQIGDEVYGNEPTNGDKGWFDRGHLVRRQDPDWGTIQEAGLADDDTFHWANCTPQYYGFNQGKELWQGLENYILTNTDEEDIKATVFTGPVFEEDDEVHRGIYIPKYFWKVVVVSDSGNKLYSSAYIVSQKKYATNIPFEVLPVGDYNHFQVTISNVEKQTGLEFSQEIREADVLKDFGMESKALRGF